MVTFALDRRGGGQALPPFLQGRRPTLSSPFQTQPMITPKSTVVPGETKSKLFGATRNLGMFGVGGISKFAKKSMAPAAPKITPAAIPAATPVGTTPQPAPAQTLYEFFKSDLERQRDAALENARADAAARGVFYGTPLTTSQGDIETEFGRGLGQLQAGILQNEQQNELQRLGLAASLLGGTPQAVSGGVSPEIFQTIGSLLAPRPGPAAPAITPAKSPPLTKEALRR